MSFLNSLKYLGRTLLRRRGRVAFLQSLRPNIALLDVGCGSNSPIRAKEQRPDISYTGLDVADYNHSHPPQSYADHYVVVAPLEFAGEIEKFRRQFDAVISSQNLEHCLEPDRVLTAMSNALREGGRLYLTFPCEESVVFPRRKGTLNFYDDPTHLQVPNYRQVLAILAKNGMVVDFARKRNRPAILFLIGLLLEPFSIIARRTMPGLSTWALYGFESVIWATRRTQ